MSYPSRVETDLAADDDPPHGVTLERYAEICARLAEGDAPRSAVAADFGLALPAFEAVSAHWIKRLAADAMEGDGELSERYAAALAAAQDALRAVPALTVEEWAALEAAKAAGDDVLAARGLSHADYLRLSRRWTRELTRDRAAAHAYAIAFADHAKARAEAKARAGR
jgi:hypothetical protein